MTNRNDASPTRVLLVDDDSALLRSVSRVLKEYEFDTETAICAAEANVILSRSTFDAIICDQKMPGTSGLDFLTQVSTEYPDLILFMLSGHISGLPVAMDWAKEIGVHEVFSKPCDANQIAETVQRAVKSRPSVHA